MRCPFCSSMDNRVIDSRMARDGQAIRRRRMCNAEPCGERFTTYEAIEDQLVEVHKKDGRREPFEPAKLARSLSLACKKRPVALDLLQDFAQRLQARLSVQPQRSISSTELGEAALGYLRELDPVAYVRYASVYRSFDSVDEFMAELQTLQSEGSELLPHIMRSS